ncbi:MAG: hypothetical protein MJZ68_05820, partial [archaeon]|nr:hypothetical protein [archaeon]
TASLFVSSMIPGSTSVSVNPQVELGVRSGSLRKLEEKIGCMVDSPEMSDRCDMAKAISGSRSRHLIIVNALSGEDGPPLHRLSEKLGIVPRYGLASKDDLHIWLYRAAPSINVDGMWDPHRSSDYRELFPTIDHVADNLDDPDIGKFVLYINELWAERSQQVHNYLCMKTIIDSKTDPLAMYRLSIMYKNGDNVPESMERSMECLMECSGKLDIAKKKLFYEYPRKHPQLREKIERYVLEHPDDGSEFYLGRCYSAMTWIDGMSDKAAEFMQKSLREGSPDHRIETFDYLWNDKARRYDDRLMGIVKGFTDLPGLGLRFGRMNLRGRGCGKDLVKAGQLITEAYREGVKGSELTLFDLYLETRDHDEEMEGLLKNGMKTDDPEAIGRMGILHFHGIGRPKSYWKAKTCFDRAMSIKRLPWIFSYQKAIRESKKKKST